MPHQPRVQASTGRPQAAAPTPVPLGQDAFRPQSRTTLTWLGMAGFLINARGTTLMIDPVLDGFDMPLLIDPPLSSAAVPHLDAVLVTHSDNDHYSEPTCLGLHRVTDAFHSTRYVAQLMTDRGLPAHGHDIGDDFSVGTVACTVLPADHAWQNSQAEPGQRVFQDADACGFWLATPDGTIWAPGDSRLIRDHHLTMPAPDALLFDFSDSEWHFGFAGAVEMANAYPKALLILHHWGSVDAPDFSPFNADPSDLIDVVVNPGRIRLLTPGVPLDLGTSQPAHPASPPTGSI